MPEAFISITTSPGPGVGSGKLRTSIFRLPRNTAPRMSGHLQMSFLAQPKNLIGVALPPIELREDLDFVEPRIARGFDPRSYPGQIDDAVAHHAAVAHQVAGRHQPVADVVGED